MLSTYLLGVTTATVGILGANWLFKRISQNMYHGIVGKKIGWRLIESPDGPVRYLELRRTETGRKEQWIKMSDRTELHLVLEVVSKYLKSGPGSRCHPGRSS